MHDVAEILARLYLENRRYTVGPLDFVASISSIIFLFYSSRCVREVFCTMKSIKLKSVFWENTE